MKVFWTALVAAAVVSVIGLGILLPGRTGALSLARAQQTEQVTLRVQDIATGSASLSCSPGGQVIARISVSGPKELAALQFELHFDQDVASLQENGVSKSAEIPGGWLFVSGAEKPGRVAVGVVGATPAATDAFSIADLAFECKSGGGSTGLTFAKITAGDVAEATLQASALDGEIKISGAAADVLIADVSIEMTAAPNPVLPGDSLTYDLKLTNTGPGQATSVTVTGTLPEEVTFKSLEASQGSCRHNAGRVKCDTGNISSGQTATVTIQVTVKAGTQGTITNSVTVEADQEDPAAHNNTATTNTFAVSASTIPTPTPTSVPVSTVTPAPSATPTPAPPIGASGGPIGGSAGGGPGGGVVPSTGATDATGQVQESGGDPASSDGTLPGQTTATGPEGQIQTGTKSSIVEDLASGTAEDRDRAAETIRQMATSLVGAQQEAAAEIIVALTGSEDEAQRRTASNIIAGLAASQDARERNAAAAVGKKAASTPEIAAEIAQAFNRVTEDVEALANLGEQLPYQLITTDRPPTPNENGWQLTGTPSPVVQVLTRFAAESPDARVEVVNVSQLPEGVVPLPEGQLVSSLIRLTAGNFLQDEVLAGHVTFSVPKAWMAEEGVHPWSIKFNRFDEARSVWVPFVARPIGEDTSHVFYTATPARFSLWAISGAKEAPGVEFRADNLQIVPGPAGPGQSVEIRADITNLTDGEGEYNGVLWIDDQVNLSRDLLIGPNSTGSVGFTVDLEPGSYTARIDRLLGNFVVEAPTLSATAATQAPPPSPMAAPDPTTRAAFVGPTFVPVGAPAVENGSDAESGFPTMIAMAIALGAVAVLVFGGSFYLWRRREARWSQWS